MSADAPSIADPVVATIAGREVEGVVVDRREEAGIHGLTTEVDVATDGGRWTVDASDVEPRTHPDD
ncbi:hypothetical protein BRC81_03040 [Halobacteriales archaeon QS_1_68_20]|nr:MAG: hypothetical protein BRC81_03040 [Halobacteriales archaeon QS_1_68_20]